MEPYDRSRRAEGLWQVVAAVLDEHGFPFGAFGYDADFREPEQWYPSLGEGWRSSWKGRAHVSASPSRGP